MNKRVMISAIALSMMLAACGGHKRGTPIPFPENGVVDAIDQLDGKTASITFGWYHGGTSELIIRDSGHGPLFRAIVPDTNVADPDLSTGFVLVDAKARRMLVFYCEVSSVLDFVAGNDPGLHELTQVELASSDRKGVAYIMGARVLNVTGIYRIPNPLMVPAWMTSHPLVIPKSVDTLDKKWHEKYFER